MKTRQLIAVVIAFSAFATVGPNFADELSEGPIAESTKSQMEVRAELDQAHADGLLMQGEGANLNEWSGAHGVAGSRYSSRTREEVKAETIAYMKDYKPAFDEIYGRWKGLFLTHQK